MSRTIKEVRAVAVSDPLEIARLAFGSVHAAAKQLKINGTAFYNWRNSRGIPLSVYRTMEHMAPGKIPPVETQRVVNNSRPFEISSPVVHKVRRAIGPFRRRKTDDQPSLDLAPATVADTPVPAESASTVTPSIDDRLAMLEAENAALRERFNRIVAALS